MLAYKGLGNRDTNHLNLSIDGKYDKHTSKEKTFPVVLTATI